jgi:hypothetical protein
LSRALTENDELERDDGLFVTDAELIRRLNVPSKIGYRAIRDLEKQHPGRPRFPQKDPMFGGRRFWPAVQKYLMLRHGLADQPFMAAPQWQENKNATTQTGEAGRDRDVGLGLETSRETLERLLDSAAGHRRRPRISHKKPTLVAAVHSADSNADA